MIVIHDAARPFVTTRRDRPRHRRRARVMAPRLPPITVRDTVKQAGDANAEGSRRIRATIPRDSVFLAQTPQAFRRDVLARALAEGTEVDATDEAMLVERLGLPVHIVEGDPRNVKITTPEDLAKRPRSEGDGSSRRRQPRHSNRQRLRSAQARRRTSADSRRRHDSVRARPRRPLGCGHRLSRRDRCGARRRGHRRHRPAVSGYRSEVEGRRQHRAAERRDREGARGRLSRVERGCDGDCAEAEAASVSRGDARESRRGARRRCRRRQREGQDERRRGKHGPR